ncbi:MAG: hypothetical protein RIF39_12915, partial [Cyclobacteriaceae bacterium]
MNNNKVVVIHDAISPEKFGTNCKKLRKHLAIDENDLLVAMVASLSSIWKQHEIFIRAVAILKEKHPNVKFAIFGPVPKKYGNEIYNTPWYYYQSLKLKAMDLNLE